MGYKLAGFKVLGGVEIDPEMMPIYKANHNPTHPFLMGVGDFNKTADDQLPAELFDLDILDGSPPCSSFSMAGSRDDKWGENTMFREGQANQVLDDLFFDFIRTATKLKPKIVVAENVKGLIMGKARGYVKQIHQGFNDAGYDVQLFLLNAAFMGVPQKRERTFFVARRKDLNLPKLVLEFNEPPISVEKALKGLKDQEHFAPKLTDHTKALWNKIMPGEALSKAHEKGHRFSAFKVNPKEPCKTLSAGQDGNPMHWFQPRRFSTLENGRIQSFPDDYNYGKFKDNYIQGMSVPPFMMQRISNQIAHQWFNKKELQHEKISG